MGCGMGDDAGASDVNTLIAQVNRFGPSAPQAAYRIVDHVIPVATGNIVTMEVALPAVVIYQQRATAAYNQFKDAGSAAQITKANQALTDPVGFVSQNMTEVTSVIAGYGDSLGLPGASGGLIGGIDTSTLLLIGVAGLGIYLLMRAS